MTEKMITYRCDHEKRLIEGVLGLEGNLCPYCDTGHLHTIARVTNRMRAEHETALEADR